MLRCPSSRSGLPDSAYDIQVNEKVHPGLLWVKAQTAAVAEDRRFEILAVSEPDLSGIRKKLEEITLQENGTEASGRRDVAQRSSGSLIEVTDDEMLVGLIDPNERPG